MCDAGLSYMTLGQPLSLLSGGERQRLKLAKHIGKKGSVIVLDEPTTGLHPSDVDHLMDLLDEKVKKGTSVIVIEHNTEVMKHADYLIDVGPDGGRDGGRIVFTGPPEQMLQADTITAICLRAAVEDRPLSQNEKDRCIHSNHVSKNSIQEDSMFKLMPIGRIVSDQEKTYIALDPALAPALTGLKGFSHIQIIWWFDRCDDTQNRAVLQHQRPYAHGPKTMGVFATRSPQRPNPIALTTAQVLWIDEEHAQIGIAFIDASNGTPVLDIKPYTPSLDRVESPETPEWCRHWPKNLESSAQFDWNAEFNFDMNE